MNENQILSQIHSPDDVKQLEENRLGELATEIRKVLVETVSQTGGHLASNLGVVELMILQGIKSYSMWATRPIPISC